MLLFLSSRWTWLGGVHPQRSPQRSGGACRARKSVRLRGLFYRPMASDVYHSPSPLLPPRVAMLGDRSLPQPAQVAARRSSPIPLPLRCAAGVLSCRSQ